MANWPTSLWLPPDEDTADFTKCRDQAVEAVERILSKCANPQAVAVSGFAKPNANKVHANWLGAEIATKQWNLLSGGLGGTMEDTMEGFVGRKVPGFTAIAILPAGRKASIPGVPSVDTRLSGKDSNGNPTHSGPASRNHVLIYCATKVICLPGTGGSIAEATLAKVSYKKPVIGYYDPQNINTNGSKWQADVQDWKKALQSLGIPLQTNPQEVLDWL